MPRVALHTILKPGSELAYVAVHRSIPAELATALREHGVRDWQIWRDGRDVFHVLDVEDYGAMRAVLGKHPANVAWQATVGPLFEKPDRYDGTDNGIEHLWSLADQDAPEDGPWH